MAVIAGDTETRGEGDDLVLWILVWSKLAAFGILLAGFLVMSLLHPGPATAAPGLPGCSGTDMNSAAWAADNPKPLCAATKWHPPNLPIVNRLGASRHLWNA